MIDKVYSSYYAMETQTSCLESPYNIHYRYKTSWVLALFIYLAFANSFITSWHFGCYVHLLSRILCLTLSLDTWTPESTFRAV